MKRITILSIFFLCVSGLSSQITIGPEAGFYYRPYTLKGIANSVSQKKLDYFLGIMGEVKFMSKMYAQSHITYVFRKNTQAASEIHTHLPDLKSGLFVNREIIFNIDILYEPIKNSKIGLGLGMIHKLDSEVQENYFYKNTIFSYFKPASVYNMSIVINQNWGRFGLTARCFSLFNSENIDSKHFRILNDRTGFTLGFNYKLLGYTKY